MKEPKQIPLSDRPRNKEPKKIRLLSSDQDFLDCLNKDENYQQNGATSVPELEPNQTN